MNPREIKQTLDIPGERYQSSATNYRHRLLS
jgi:hypothetical protein